MLRDDHPLNDLVPPTRSAATGLSLRNAERISLPPARSESVEYQSLGCWRDTRTRAILTLEETDPRLDNSYPERRNPIEKCYQDGGQCFGSADAQNTYKKYGPSTACAADGEGGPRPNAMNDCTQMTKKWGGWRGFVLDATIVPDPPDEDGECEC
ncbi:hypothetical protein Bbelb_070890 [Branchiostoma belcheri]|nr:hypothetical protein Bbelb_070890 [Branchiostoma belcheri]